MACCNSKAHELKTEINRIPLKNFLPSLLKVKADECFSIVHKNQPTCRPLVISPATRFPEEKRYSMGNEDIIFLNKDITILPENMCTSFHLENSEFGSQ